MYNKIMVPLDGSEYSECVLEHVKALATGCKVPEVVILYVAEPVFQGVYEVPENVIKDARQRREEFARQYVEKTARKLAEAGITVSTAIEQGRPAEAILEYAKANKVDLIVMSTHGRSGVSRWMLGSVADRVARHAEQPVLLVTPPGCRIMTEAM